MSSNSMEMLDTFTLDTNPLSLRAVQTIGININLFHPRGRIQAKERSGRDRTDRDFLVGERDLLSSPRIGQADGKREKDILHLPIVAQLALGLECTGRISDRPASETICFRLEPQRCQAAVRATKIESVGACRFTAHRYDCTFHHKGRKAHQQARDLARREQHLGQTSNIERAGNPSVEDLIARQIGGQLLPIAGMDSGHPQECEQFKAKAVRSGKRNGLCRRTLLVSVPVRDLGQPTETGDGLLPGLKRGQQFLGGREGG